MAAKEPADPDQPPAARAARLGPDDRRRGHRGHQLRARPGRARLERHRRLPVATATSGTPPARRARPCAGGAAGRTRRQPARRGGPAAPDRRRDRARRRAPAQRPGRAGGTPGRARPDPDRLPAARVVVPGARSGVQGASLRWERYAARWTTELVCVSTTERQLGESLGVHAPTTVLPNGIDLTRFRPGGARDRVAARKPLGLDDVPTAAVRRCADRAEGSAGPARRLAARSGRGCRTPSWCSSGTARTGVRWSGSPRGGRRGLRGRRGPTCRPGWRPPTWSWSRRAGRGWRWCRSRRWPAPAAWSPPT